MKTTHTYALLEVSAAAHKEILGKLKAAGYEHAIEGDVIDMHGIALKPEAAARDIARDLAEREIRHLRDGKAE